MSKQTTRVRKLAITLFFLLIFLLVVLLSIKDKTIDFANILQPNKISQPASKTNTISLPVALNHPNAGQIFLIYNFSGQIKHIKTSEEETQIILDIPDTNIPFILDPDTQIFKVSEGDRQPESATIKDLKTNDRVNIQMLYDLKLESWRTIRVDIIN